MSTKAKTTIAQDIADDFHSDGQCRMNARGQSIEEVLTGRGHNGTECGDDCRWEFDDGSAIILTDDCWDIGHAQCFGTCFAGDQCGCPKLWDVATNEFVGPTTADHVEAAGESDTGAFIVDVADPLFEIWTTQEAADAALVSMAPTDLRIVYAA